MKGKWNYEEAEVTIGTVICGKSKKDTWWCAKDKGKRLCCIKITQDDYTFFIYNGDGSGYRKAMLSGGGPDSCHASIPVDDPDTFQSEGRKEDDQRTIP